MHLQSTIETRLQASRIGLLLAGLGERGLSHSVVLLVAICENVERPPNKGVNGTYNSKLTMSPTAGHRHAGVNVS